MAERLGALPELRVLLMSYTGISDEGLTHLRTLKRLETLDIRKTRVTAAGVKQLQEAIPDCTIHWDGEAGGES